MEALEWYTKRGFEVEEELVRGYYRKLRPSGARVVKRIVSIMERVEDLRAEGDKRNYPDGVNGGKSLNAGREGNAIPMDF